MTSVDELNSCSMCKRSSANFLCVGCNRYFCSKHFKEHEEHLGTRFNEEIVKLHDELIGEIQKFDNSNKSLSDLFDQIEQWRKATVDKIEKAADRARHELTELINQEKTTITKQLEPVTKEIRGRQGEHDFVESDIHRLRQQLTRIHGSLQHVIRKDTNRSIVVEDDKIKWDQLIIIHNEHHYSPFTHDTVVVGNVRWTSNGITVAGGNEHGSELNQLNHPWGLCVDEEQTVYIAEYSNHRIVEWKCGATIGRVVAGGNGNGHLSNQLSYPTDVAIDQETDSLIICDYNNKRVVRWPRQNSTNGEIIISNIGCVGVTIDENGYLYVVDHDAHAVKRYRIGDTCETVVAGGNGPGDRLDQLHHPRYVFVDRDSSVYVSDYRNHRIVKWMAGAKQGIIVAGGHGEGHGLNQISNPYGIIVDQSKAVYVADYANSRIMRWSAGATQGCVIIGSQGQGHETNQLHNPIGLTFDHEGNLYISDNGNHRIQKFDIDHS